MRHQAIFGAILAILLLSHSVQSISIFSSKPGEPDTSPSIQLILRNIGLGLFSDPVFNRLRRRWDTLRTRYPTNPILAAILPNGANSPAAQAAAHAAVQTAVRMLTRQ